MEELNNIEGLIKNPSNEVELYDDYAIDFSKVMPEVYFVGKIPFHAIIEGITEQFTDYINTDDRTNYVSEFYQQLSDSYALIDDESNEYYQGSKEILDRIHNIFTSHLVDLFD